MRVAALSEEHGERRDDEAAESPPTSDTAETNKASDTPVGFIGVVSPMTTLGLAPFSYLGLVYPKGLVLSSAALYQVTFSRQQERIVEELMATSFDDLTGSGKAHVYDWAHIEEAELRRQFAVGYRIDFTMRGRSSTRLIVQQRRVEEIRRCLGALLDDRWVDETPMAA
jgi:hypothetical protein